MYRTDGSAAELLKGGSRRRRLPPTFAGAQLRLGWPWRVGRGGFVAVAGAFALALSASPACAATYHATDGASLQSAVASADASSGASTIELSAGVFLPTSTLAISSDVTIVGPASAPGAKLYGSAVMPFPSDLLLVEAHAKLTLENVELTGGGGQGTAAAIDDFGAVDLESSTDAGNSAPGLLVQRGATATVRNSTLSDGLAFGVIDDGSASFYNSTVAFNENGGIENQGTLDLTNTVVAENSGSGDCVGKANASDHSLDSDGSCGVGVLSKTNPLLATGLRNNGGSTPTHALEAGSPAIGAGDESKCPSEDQRHFARSGGRCDIGAYQAGATPGGAQGGAGGTGSGSGSTPGAATSGLVGVNAHGTLRGPRRSRITFTVRAEVGRASSKFLYVDGDRHVRLRALSVKSLAIDARRGTVTLRGSGVIVASRRRVSVTVVLVDYAGHRSLRIGLSNGYHYSGQLLSGSIAFLRRGTPG